MLRRLLKRVFGFVRRVLAFPVNVLRGFRNRD